MVTSYNLGLFFEKVVNQHGDKVALTYKDSSCTYTELNRLANQIARFLIDKDIISQDVVGIFNSKEKYALATMIACLKIGAIYTNLDDDNPPARLTKMIETAKVSLIISDHDLTEENRELLTNMNLAFVVINSHHCLDKYKKDNLSSTKNITGTYAAYIMFTSGSTGTPKGAAIAHQSIINFIQWSLARFEINTDDRFCGVSAMYFDNSVFDFYTALFSGARLAPLNKEIVESPTDLINTVDQLGCTIWFSVPSLLVYLSTMKVLQPDNMETIRSFVFGGEGFPKNQLKKLYELYGDKKKFINVYGPTEGTCICSAYDIQPGEFDNMDILAPLGKINPGFSYLILNNHKKVKLGEKGELCLLGPNLALGYYNDIERTNSSFIQNPYQTNFTEVMYKTGDIVFEDNQGLMNFAGRRDNQIKHMGYRIELEEIEAAINSLGNIHHGAVLYNRIRESYGKIIAFVVSETETTEESIKRELAKFLPTYMIPNIIEVRDSLPKNANGKIDKERLFQTLS